LKRLASFVILLVCTGNTCRSPMAECMLRHHLAEALETTPEDLEERGVIVMSAGIAAMSGGRSTPEAVQAMAERGLDLSQHESQPLSDRLVRYADLILTMTRGHREAIRSQWLDAAERTRLLCRDQSDVADPIGGPQELYTRCAAQIDSQLKLWVREFDFDSLLCVRTPEEGH
jgi:protein-tyrosine phosphatase